jgi:hypothetical protein
VTATFLRAACLEQRVGSVFFSKPPVVTAAPWAQLPPGLRCLSCAG